MDGGIWSFLFIHIINKNNIKAHFVFPIVRIEPHTIY